VEQVAIDANWQTDLVYKFCRESQWRGRVIPYHGRYIGASSRPMAEYKKAAGARLGEHWYMPPPTGKRPVRHVAADVNWAKGFALRRFMTAPGEPGCYSLFGEDPEAHEMARDHLCSEYFVTAEARGRKVDEWKQKPGEPDNHFLDCLAGTVVLASMAGCRLPVARGAPAARNRPRRIRYG
jgi:hypothetical protein